MLPWARGVFELIIHGELHLRNGEDFDRRMALISFDNAIEVAIGTYLALNPIQRGNRTYQRSDVERWLTNYPSRLEFLEIECTQRGVGMTLSRAEILWYHGIRNDQYHAGPPTTPNIQDLLQLRRACLWIFSVLFDIPDVEALIDQHIAALQPPMPVFERDKETDDIIDEFFGPIEIGDFTYQPSELLFSHDPNAYRELGLTLRTPDNTRRSA